MVTRSLGFEIGGDVITKLLDHGVEQTILGCRVKWIRTVSAIGWSDGGTLEIENPTSEFEGGIKRSDIILQSSHGIDPCRVPPGGEDLEDCFGVEPYDG